MGGNTQNKVTKRTTMLVKGTFTHKHEVKNKLREEERKVKQLELLGHWIVTLSEKEFLILANQQLVNLIRKGY